MPKSSEPLYRYVVRRINSSIQNGDYPVGTRLPTEMELSKQFKASRHTIREALRHLRAGGQICSRQGSGWVVTKVGQRANYLHAVADLSELLQYAAKTQLKLDRVEMVTADARLARRLGCSVGRKWLRLEGLNYEPGSETPSSWSEIFVHNDFKRIQTLAAMHSEPIIKLIESEFGERLAEVRQTLRAANVPPELAERLQTEAGSPALELEHIYLTERDKTVEIAFSLRPSDRFSYSVTLRRQIED